MDMRRPLSYLIVGLGLLGPGVAQACNPTTAPQFSAGCQPVATTNGTSDTLTIWIPGDFPAAAQQIAAENLEVTGGGSRNSLATWTGYLTGAAVPNPLRYTGVTDASSAAAGIVGEYVSSSIPSGSAVSLSTGTGANVTSVSLTAGDWSCSGNVDFYPAGSTTISAIAAAISTTSATNPTKPGGGSYAAIAATLTTGAAQDLPVGSVRENVSITTTVYLVGTASFGTSTMTAGGFLGCRRVR